MKKAIITIALISPIMLFAQTSTDSVNNNSGVVSIGMEELFSIQSQKKDAEQKLAEATSKFNDLQAQFDVVSRRIASDSTKISSLSNENAVMSQEISELKRKLEISNTYLFNIASNFIYIPFESFGVDQIAIPACQQIQDKNLEEQSSIRKDLLINYKKHIEDLITYLKEPKKKPNPFDKSGEAAKSNLADFHNKDFYKSYQKYDDWANTYLGKIFKRIEVLLKNPNEDGFEDIIQELTKCINS